MENTPKVCIIGAGSSGIVAAKVLHQHGIPFDCFEKGSGIGGNWRFHNDNGQSAAYQSLHINTSKTKMAYSDFPMPDDYPDYPGHRQIFAYLQAFARDHGLDSDIRFDTEVTVVELLPGLIPLEEQARRIRAAKAEQESEGFVRSAGRPVIAINANRTARLVASPAAQLFLDPVLGACR